ncbi:MAG: parallel beta-helix repeat-containing protein [Puniceicoccaceae bacterium 5H]|nr:MAG: parallel beta-helix repeat-containing protein [Puniceicoccaceae bacterium 5H]
MRNTLLPFFRTEVSCLVAALMLLTGACHATPDVGADLPWTTYEAEAMQTDGQVLGPAYGPHTLESESSHQRAVRLHEEGAYVAFIAQEAANALIVRFSLPDAPEGGGTATTLRLSINGKAVRALELSSRNAWLYGDYPFSNDPAQGKPRNFYDEARVKGLQIAAGDTVRLEKTSADGVACTVDLVDIEPVPAALSAPDDALSLEDFGAVGDGQTDATEALKTAVEAAQEQGRPVWVPAGDYRITGDIVVPSAVTIQGAGMWHTTFVGNPELYDQADRRVRFKLQGKDIRLADFAIVGALNYRNDQEPNDGVIGSICQNATISRLWIEHTKVGVWIYNGVGLKIEGCRFRNMLADGVNLCVGSKDNLVENCSARGTGDDCFAIWPAASDQGYIDENVVPGNNVIRRCTGQLTFLANGASVYGGANNRVEDCLFTDIGTGCGILISTTFPTSDEARGIDNNFSGTTVVEHCRLVRCGGYDHAWAWRGSFQICMDRRSISGLEIREVDIRDSFSGGLTVVGPGSQHGEGTLSDSSLRQVRVQGVGLGAKDSHDLFIREDARGGLTLIDCQLDAVANASEHFDVERK